MAKKKKSSARAGSDSNLWAGIAYVFGFVTGILAYLVRPNDKFVRFHAVQSILACIAVLAVFIVLGIFAIPLGAIIGLIPILNIIVFTVIGLVVGVLNLLIWLLFLYFAYKAFNGEKYKLPFVGDMAEKYSK